jgi:hypothetical protein
VVPQVTELQTASRALQFFTLQVALVKELAVLALRDQQVESE